MSCQNLFLWQKTWLAESPDSSAELLAFVSINMAENVLKSHQTSGLSGLSGLFDGSWKFLSKNSFAERNFTEHVPSSLNLMETEYGVNSFSDWLVSSHYVLLISLGSESRNVLLVKHDLRPVFTSGPEQSFPPDPFHNKHYFYIILLLLHKLWSYLPSSEPDPFHPALLGQTDSLVFRLVSKKLWHQSFSWTKKVYLKNLQ